MPLVASTAMPVPLTPSSPRSPRSAVCCISALRRSDFAAAEARLAARSAHQTTSALPTMAHRRRTSGVVSPVSPWWWMNASETVVARNHAWAATSAAVTTPRATDISRYRRVARVYRNRRGSMGGVRLDAGLTGTPPTIGPPTHLGPRRWQIRTTRRRRDDRPLEAAALQPRVGADPLGLAGRPPGLPPSAPFENHRKEQDRPAAGPK